MHIRGMNADGIKKLRTDRGWTQEQLAEYLGLDRSTVSRLESGQEPSGPTMRLLGMLASQPLPTSAPTPEAVE